MNATPMNLTPGNAVQAASQAGKQSDATSPDVPFSQVLSGEIAQSRKNDASRESSDANAGADPASQAASPADGKADPAQPTKAGEDAVHERRAPSLDKDKDAALDPETLLALAISPDAFKPAAASAGKGFAAAEPASSPGASALGASTLGTSDLRASAKSESAQSAPALPGLDARKGRATPVMQAGQRADDAHGTQKPNPGLSAKEDALAAEAARATPPADTAPTFAGQLAAARQSDATKTGELLSDLMSNPAMRAVPHAPIETKLASADAAAPRLTPTVGTTAWGQALGEKLVWMAAGTQQTASLTLNPPNLGPLQIVLNVTNDQATASFFSAQPEVRQALESAFPRLREMMNDAGIQLGQATVSADTPQQNDTPDRQAQRVVPPFPGADNAAPASLQAVHAPVRQSGRGLVDTFA